MGATLSVSRPLVDAGWVSNARQVGQSGKTVKPKVYLALGISGAVQHLAGMQNADTIIAVNTDPEAPIFRIAHYGAVVDLFDVADELAEQFGGGHGLVAPLAAEKTREVFWDFEPALEVLWYVLAVFSVLVFAYGVARPVAKYRRSHGGGWPPRSELPGRLREAFRILLSHASIKRRDPYAGWAHRGIFYGFVVLFIGTVILAINTDFTEPVFGWRFFEGNFYLGYSIVLDVLGLALLAGVVMMMVRRPSSGRASSTTRAPTATPTSAAVIASATGPSSGSC